MRDFELARYAAVIVCIVGVCSVAINGCNQTELTHRVRYVAYADAVAHSNDPVATGCAFGTQGGEGNTSICVLNQNKENQK